MKHSCLGVFLAFLFVIFFLVAFVLFNLKATFLNVDFYKTEFVKANLYSQLTDLVPKIIAETAKQKVGQAAQYKQFAQIAKKSITPTWIKQQTEKNLDSVFDWFYGKTNTLKIEVSLTPIKGEFEKLFFAELKKNYNNLPKCTSQSQANSANSFDCRAPGKSFEDVQTEILRQMGSDNPVNQFPDNFKWELGAASQNVPPIFANAGSISRIISWVFYIFLTLAILMLAILGILSRKSLRSMFRWLGIPLAIPSFLLLIIFGIARIFASVAASKIYLPFAANSGTGGTAGADLGTSLFTSLFTRIVLDIGNIKLLEAIVIFAVAVVLIIISFFFKKITAEPVPAKTIAPAASQVTPK